MRTCGQPAAQGLLPFKGLCQLGRLPLAFICLLAFCLAAGLKAPALSSGRNRPHDALAASQRSARKFEPRDVPGWRRRLATQAVDVADAQALLAALRASDVGVIRIVNTSISINTQIWRELTTPLGVSRDVLVVGGGRYGPAGAVTSAKGPHLALDFGYLAGKLQLLPRDTTQGPLLQFRGLRLLHSFRPTGYDLAILSSSAGATIVYEDCVLERDVGLPIASVAAEAQMAVEASGDVSTRVTLTSVWCPPNASAVDLVESGCFTNGALLYRQLSLAVKEATAQTVAGVNISAETANSSTKLTMVTLQNCTYGVRHEVSPSCVEAYGADYCVYSLQAALRQQGGGSARTGLSAGAGAGVAVAATLAACLALFLLARFLRRVRNGHRTLTLAVRPPGATALTTLLVTDIQDSTVLWEALPTTVMNEALRLHHKCLRSLLPKCNGYESATEGDSFILAFHTPMDASRFALLAQHALMELSWPAELLGHAAGCEVWAEPSKPKVGRGGLHSVYDGGLGLSGAGFMHHNYTHIADDESDDDDASAVVCDAPSAASHGPQWWLHAALGSPNRRRTGHGKGPNTHRKFLTPRPSTSERPTSGLFANGQLQEEGPAGAEPQSQGPGPELSPFKSAGIKVPGLELLGERIFRERTAPPLLTARLSEPAHAPRGASFDSRLHARAPSRAAGPSGLRSTASRHRLQSSSDLEKAAGAGFEELDADSAPTGTRGAEGVGSSLLTSLTLRFVSRSNSARVLSAAATNTAEAAADGSSLAFPRWKAALGSHSPRGNGTESDTLAWTTNPVADLATQQAGGPDDGDAQDAASGRDAVTLAEPNADTNSKMRSPTGRPAHASPLRLGYYAGLPTLLAPPSTPSAKVDNGPQPPHMPASAGPAAAAANALLEPRAGPVAEGVEGQHQVQPIRPADAADALEELNTTPGDQPAGPAVSPPSSRQALVRNTSYGPSSSVPAVPSRLGPRYTAPAPAAAPPLPDLNNESHVLLRPTQSSELIFDGAAFDNASLRQYLPTSSAAMADMQLQQLLPVSGELLNASATGELLALLRAAQGSSGDRTPGPAASEGVTAAAPVGDMSSRAPGRFPVQVASEQGGLLRKHASQEYLSTGPPSVQPPGATSASFIGLSAFNREIQSAVLRQGHPTATGSAGIGPVARRPPSRGRAHTVHGYQQERAHGQAADAGGNPQMSHATVIAAGRDSGTASPHQQYLHRPGAGSGSLKYSRTQAIEMVPLPTKVPEVRQTWREMCASHWLVLPSSQDVDRENSSLDLPQNSLAGRQLNPHPEADRDADDVVQSLYGHRHPHGHAPAPQLHPSQAGVSHKAHKGSVLLFRGVRVRMGLHTGIPLTTDVTFNHTTGHMAYSGMPLKIAKAVGDGAAGGSVLLSNTTFNLVHPHLADLPGHARLVYCGDAQVELVIRSLYMLADRDLQPRFGFLPPLRNLRMVQLGNLEAPVGNVAICFMTVSGATKAVAELGQPAVSALQEFKTIVTFECCQCGGFVVEATDGLCLAAFMEPAAAAIWALRCKEVLMAHSWSREVLVSTHFREVREASKVHRGRGLPSRRTTHVVSRGPRIRCGIAVGPVTAEVSAATARLAYRGKVMNRSARVAAQASDGQVLLSEAAWQRVVATVGVHALADTLPQRKDTLRWQDSDASNPAAGLPHAGAPPGSPATPLLSANSSAGLPNAGSGGLGSAAGAGNLLRASAEQMLSAAAEDGDAEDVEALAAAAAATCAELPAVPQGHVLGGSSAGVFNLKGVPEPQELFEVHLAPAPLLSSGAPSPRIASLTAGQLPSVGPRTQPPSAGRAGGGAATVYHRQPAGAPPDSRSPVGAHASRPRHPVRNNEDGAVGGGRSGARQPLVAAAGAAMLEDSPTAGGREGEAAEAGPADGFSHVGAGGALAEGSSGAASREASVIGQLDAAELAELRALAGTGRDPGGVVEFGEGSGGPAGAVPCEASAMEMVASQHGHGGAVLHTAGAPSISVGLEQKQDGGKGFGDVRSKKPLAGDALLEALVEAALESDEGAPNGNVV